MYTFRVLLFLTLQYIRSYNIEIEFKSNVLAT